MPLTVLNVAYPFAPVGLDAVGGAEQILALLDRGNVVIEGTFDELQQSDIRFVEQFLQHP